LSHTQQNDAHAVAQYIMEHTHADLITIITDFKKVHNLISKISEPVNWLALLHEFVAVEKNYIVEVLTRNNADLKIIELW
jgi:negative regulator of genetic competence, sporulation and motility